MVKSGVTVVLDKTAGIAEAIAVLASTRVSVGIPQDKDERKGDGEINNAALGYIHEHGAPEAGIPERPWLVPGVKSAQDDITVRLKQAGAAALEGKKSVVEKIFHAVGLIGQAAARSYIQASEHFEPLLPRTLKARERRGRTGDKPLIDTGQMRNSVTYVIRKTK